MKKENKVVIPDLELSRRFIIIFLTMISAITIVIRVVYPFHIVFNGSFTNFLEGDAWNRMMYARNMAGMGFFESIGYMVQNNLLFSWVISVFGRVFSIEAVGAWLPPIMAVGVVITVYFIGKAIFNKTVGLFGAMFVAVIPSEFLHRSLLGFTDQHILEVLLMALFILFLIKAIQGQGYKYSALATLMFLLYMFNWKTGIYIMGLLLVLILIALGVYHWWNREGFKPLIPVGIITVCSLGVYFALGGYRQILYFIPGQETAQGALTTGEIIDTGLQSLGQRTTSELMPLLYPYGSLNFGVIISNLHMFIFSFIGGVVYAWKSRSNKLILLFTVWTILILAITLNERRFLYYLTLNIGIISAFAIYKVAQRLKGKLFQNVVTLSIPFLFISVFLAKGVSADQPVIMSQEWHEALTWLNGEPETGYVSAWTDYGHWIEYVSRKKANYLPGPGGTLIAKFFLSSDPLSAKKYLDSMGTAYLIVDSLSANPKVIFPTLEIYAENYPQPQLTMIYELFYTDKVPSYLELAYQSQNIKIFRYKG